MNAMQSTRCSRLNDTPTSVGRVLDRAPRADGPGDVLET